MIYRNGRPIVGFGDTPAATTPADHPHAHHGGGGRYMPLLVGGGLGAAVGGAVGYFVKQGVGAAVGAVLGGVSGAVAGIKMVHPAGVILHHQAPATPPAVEPAPAPAPASAPVTV
jgi:hypothetical protein